MTTGTLVRALRRLALFQGLTAIQLAEIVDLADKVSFDAEDAIIVEGETGDAAFVLLSGVCQGTSGRAFSPDSETVPVGSLIGEMAMLIETSHTSTVICRSRVESLKITRAALHARMSADPSLAEHFVSKITSRLHAIADELRRCDDALAPRPRTKQSVVPALPPPSPSSFQVEACH